MPQIRNGSGAHVLMVGAPRVRGSGETVNIEPGVDRVGLGVVPQVNLSVFYETSRYVTSPTWQGSDDSTGPGQV